jgi:hypothetical protein
MPPRRELARAAIGPRTSARRAIRCICVAMREWRCQPIGPTIATAPSFAASDCPRCSASINPFARHRVTVIHVATS